MLATPAVVAWVMRRAKGDTHVACFQEGTCYLWGIVFTFVLPGRSPVSGAVVCSVFF